MCNEKLDNYSFLLDKALEEKNIDLFNSIPKEYIPKIDVTQDKLNAYCKENNLLKLKYVIMFSKIRDVIDLILVYASKHGNLDIIKYSLEHGANVNFENAWAIRMASICGHLDVVQYLSENCANIKHTNNGSLLYACRGGSLDIVKYLLENGSNIHEWGESPFIGACEFGQLDVVKYLLENGANSPKNKKDGIAIAKQNKHWHVVEYLENLK